MKTISNIRELPVEALRVFAVKDKAEAEKKAEGYSVAWYYENRGRKGKILPYLYLLNKEYEEKKFLGLEK